MARNHWKKIIEIKCWKFYVLKKLGNKYSIWTQCECEFCSYQLLATQTWWVSFYHSSTDYHSVYPTWQLSKSMPKILKVVYLLWYEQIGKILVWVCCRHTACHGFKNHENGNYLVIRWDRKRSTSFFKYEFIVTCTSSLQLTELNPDES